MSNKNNKRLPNYSVTKKGQFRINNYDKASPFSSFLPGIAGPRGVPLWCMYVNRGQAIASFGVGNKDNAISEFLSATWAYQLVGIQGFRTFCKINDRFYEPFQNHFVGEESEYLRSMLIDFDRIIITEANKNLGLNFEIEYFSPVNQKNASLVRKVNITNTSGAALNVELLDGMAVFVPAGLTDNGLKAMRHLNEAYSHVNFVNGHVALASAKVLAHDEPEITKVEQGNFYSSWFVEAEDLKPVDILTDPGVIFGKGNELVCPYNFIDGSINPESQVLENRLPCAFSTMTTKIEPGQTTTLISLVGFTRDKKSLKDYLSNFKSVDDFKHESEESRKLIDEITKPAFLVSNSALLDNYTKQNYLDNILRGGIPLMLQSSEGKVPLHIYSRRHGDLERDYNYFQLPLHPLSSGPGNYRDIYQNRRYDIWFYPELFDQEIKMFVSLIQADGYNPLGIDGYNWVLEKNSDAELLCPDKKEIESFKRVVLSDFHPGQLLEWTQNNGIKLENPFQWLNSVLSKCKCQLQAAGYEGGYWVDHWIYVVDMLEAFEGLYPDRVTSLMTEKEDISWFYEKAFVNPRSEKYVARKNAVLQLNAVKTLEDNIVELPNVTLLAKLISLISVKAVTFDYECKGIEMEAGRPGWNDSLNGLPALFGSSTCQVAAAARLVDWMLEHLKELPQTKFPKIVTEFIKDVLEDLKHDEHDWDRAANIRENYRKSIASNNSSDLVTIDGETLSELLNLISQKAHKAVGNSIRDDSLINTYYISEPIDSRIENDGEFKKYTIEKFTQKPLPLFLEGQVHLLRIIKDKTKARAIHNAIKKSPLYDQQLQMYKLNECLDSWPHEIGRARTFSRGWFENESIWLHMSYKYLLELLKAGLYEEFFEDANTMLVPFMDPEVYGRSTLENSSFIASSACVDPSARGKGFIARLSGACAEFIHIWLLLTVGPKPFQYDNDGLRLAFDPILPCDWFLGKSKQIQWQGESVVIPENSLSCAFLGDILLIYSNPNKGNTFGQGCVRPIKYILDDEVEIEGTEIKGNYAEAIRNHKIKKIEVIMRKE